MRHNFFSILTLYYIAIKLNTSDFKMSDKFLDTSIASHEVLLYWEKTSDFWDLILSNLKICSQNWHFIKKEKVMKLKISIQTWSFKFGIYFSYLNTIYQWLPSTSSNQYLNSVILHTMNKEEGKIQSVVEVCNLSIEFIW